MMVSEPPSSMLRAAPKKRLGRCSALESHTAGEDLAGGRHDGVVGAGKAGDGVQQNDDIALVLDQALGLLDDHLGDLDVAGGGLVEGGADDLALHAALHVGDLFRALIDEQDDEDDFGVVGVIRVRDGLHEDGLAGAGRSDDKSALAFADRRQKIHQRGRKCPRERSPS